MILRAIAGTGLALALAACGPAKIEGPLTQAVLDQLEGECGVSAARLVSVDAANKAKIEIGGLAGADDSAIAGTIINGKCLEDHLAARGVTSDVSLDLSGTQYQQQMQAKLDKAFQ